jgi:lipoprotein signal peptidase
MSLLILIIALLLEPKWYYALSLNAAFVGGLFNIFDKVAHHNEVIDYFDLFPPNSWFIFNIPDFYITGGIIFTCVSYIVVTITKMVKEKKAKSEKVK